MKKRILIVPVLVAIALSLCILMGRWRKSLIGEGMREAKIEDFSWSYSLFMQSTTNDRLREHLKARVYYQAQYISDDALASIPNIDFGPIDEEMLGAFKAAPPHADSPNEYYRALLKRLKK